MFGRHRHKTELEIIKEQAEIIEQLVKYQHRPIFTLSIKIQNQFYIMSDISLVLGTPKDGLFTLIDNVTGKPITGVTYSNQALGTNTNPGAATFSLDASGTSVTGTPVAAGSGTLGISTSAAWTDPATNTPQTGTFTITKNFTVGLAIDGVTFDIVFS